MAVYKKILCVECGAQMGNAAKESDPSWKKKTCKCGGSAKLHANWCVAVYLPGSDGKQHRKVHTIRGSKSDAERTERELLTKRDEGAIYEKPRDYTLKSFDKTWQEWITTREKQGKLASGSAKSYVMRTDVHIMPEFGSIDMRHLSYDDVDNYVEQRQSDTVTPATINREIATLKRILSVAVQRRVLRHNPLTGYELLPEDNERDRHLSDEEIGKLYGECLHKLAPKHLLPIVTLMLNTGLRIEGVLTLRWEEIKWKAGVSDEAGNVSGEIQKIVKGSKKVHIPMTTELRESLTQWRIKDGVQKVTGWVFPSTKKPDSHMLVTSNFGLGAALSRAGIKDCTNHTLRHTFATRFLEQFPEHIETLRDILGHSSSYITRRYAHLTAKTKHLTMAGFKVTG